MKLTDGEIQVKLADQGVGGRSADREATAKGMPQDTTNI